MNKNAITIAKPFRKDGKVTATWNRWINKGHPYMTDKARDGVYHTIGDKKVVYYDSIYDCMYERPWEFYRKVKAGAKSLSDKELQAISQVAMDHFKKRVKVWDPKKIDVLDLQGDALNNNSVVQDWIRDGGWSEVIGQLLSHIFTIEVYIRANNQ